MKHAASAPKPNFIKATTRTIPTQVVYSPRVTLAMPSDFHKLISAPAAQLLRDTIREARGNEVFFLAKPDEHGVVTEVTPLARGNDSAVPALLQVTSPGDVVIHNHPSGYLTPSSADVSLASEYGNQGVGFYIINNEADAIYVVVEAFQTPAATTPGLGTQLAAQNFRREGKWRSGLTGFESRPEQQRMLRAVATAFNESKAALIEAGTGTGKSLAYLLPAIHWAVQNKQRVVVSTNTINLQEQLMHKDLPLLQQALDLKFKPVLVKGRQNYVCLSKVETIEKEGDYLIETDERTELKAILEWSHRTSEGSRSDLSILPRFPVWEKVACESDNCSRIRCSHYNELLLLQRPARSGLSRSSHRQSSPAVCRPRGAWRYWALQRSGRSARLRTRYP